MALKTVCSSCLSWNSCLFHLDLLWDKILYYYLFIKLDFIDINNVLELFIVSIVVWILQSESLFCWWASVDSNISGRRSWGPSLKKRMVGCNVWKILKETMQNTKSYGPQAYYRAWTFIFSYNNFPFFLEMKIHITIYIQTLVLSISRIVMAAIIRYGKWGYSQIYYLYTSNSI